MNMLESDRTLHVILRKKKKEKLGESKLGLKGALEAVAERGWRPIEEDVSAFSYGNFGRHEISNPRPLERIDGEGEEYPHMVYEFNGSWILASYRECRIGTLEQIAEDYEKRLTPGSSGTLAASVIQLENQVQIRIDTSPPSRELRKTYEISRKEMLLNGFYGVYPVALYAAEYLKSLGIVVPNQMGAIRKGSR